ncbi:MAG: serine/threonine-protein kinase [Kofleriaceae bacterium]
MRTLGRYELLRPLARGGMAEVYLARRRVAGVEKRLVIKRLRRERMSDPRFLDLFVKEAQLSMGLVQQNIVPVFDFGRIGDDVFLAMEHIDGKDLGSSLTRRRGQGMPPLIAAFVASECCHALHHAHCGTGSGGRSVVHRDVTPRNVLLSWTGEVKLADFGIASAMGSGDASLVGTPGYMAPEQARGQPVDARTDLYSLALVLWEMLIGDHVRRGADQAALLDAAKRNELPALPAAAPPALAELLRRATDEDPAKRLDSARAMADELDAFMVGERARISGAAPAQQLAGWLRQCWADAADDALEFSGVDGGRMVTFLDDGAAGVLGTGTIRSMAATAGPGDVEGDAAAGARADVADDGEGEEDGDGVEGDEPGARAGTAGSARSSASLAAEAAPVSEELPRAAGARAAGRAVPAHTTTRRGLVLVGVALAAGLGSVVAYRALATRAQAPAEALAIDALAIDAPALQVDAGLVAAASLDAPIRPDADAALAAPADAARPEAPRDASSLRVPRDGADRRRPPRGGSAAPDAGVVEVRPLEPAVAARRRFTIGAKPWAHFQIDGDPKTYETPATLELTLGAHRVHFVNPALGITKDVTIRVGLEGPASHVELLQDAVQPPSH